MKTYLGLTIILLLLVGCSIPQPKTETPKIVITPAVNIENQTVKENLTKPSPEEYDETKPLSWSSLPITFFITNEKECDDYESRRIRRAFNKIQEATNNVISFEEVNSSRDSNIDITCSFLENCYEYKIDIRKEEGLIYRYESICSHTKGIAQITKTEGNSILKAEIELIGLAGFSESGKKEMSGYYIGNCGFLTTEIHEILHTFGYKHINNSKSIMYYSDDAVGYTIQNEGDCQGSNKEIDKAIIDDLIKRYD